MEGPDNAMYSTQVYYLSTAAKQTTLKHSGLKTVNTCYLMYFLWVRNLETAKLNDSGQDLSWSCSDDDHQGFSLLKAWQGLESPLPRWFTWLLAWGLSSSWCELLQWASWMFLRHGKLLFLEKMIKKKKKKKVIVPFITLPLCHFQCISFIRSKSLSPAHIQERGEFGFIFWKQECQRIVNIFQDHLSRCISQGSPEKQNQQDIYLSSYLYLS